MLRMIANFTDSKVGADWLETHVYIPKYCLQIAKYNDLGCCKPARTNVQEVLGGKFLPAPLALTGGPSPKAYKQCVKLPYDLYCPSTKVDDAEYVCAHCKKICTTKELLKFHLRSTQHHSFEPEPDVENLESENNDCDVDGLPDIVDGPCLIPCMERFLESTWDITYE